MSQPRNDACFRTPLPLRWSDLDAFNHVNNARYLTFVEEARIVWLESLDGPWLTDAAAPVVASATLNFKRPIEYPTNVFVELFTEKLGNSSVVIGHRIVADDGTVHCDGSVVAVWVDRASGKPTPLLPAVRRAAEAMLQG